MSAALARLARSLTHHWKRGALAAVASLVLLGALAGTTGGPAPDDFRIPGAESQKAIDLFKAHTPALAGADATVVFSTPSGALSDPAKRAAIQESRAAIERLPGVASVGDPFAEGGQVSDDGRIAAVDVRYTTEPQDIEKEDGEKLEDAARTGEQDGVEVSMRGQVVDIAAQQEAPVGELIGVALAIVLLTLLFRSLAAMGATLLGALLGVMTGRSCSRSCRSRSACPRSRRRSR
jgi:RND superfamily putative drug exporter